MDDLDTIGESDERNRWVVYIYFEEEWGGGGCPKAPPLPLPRPTVRSPSLPHLSVRGTSLPRL